MPDIQALPFFGPVELSHSVDSGMMLFPYLLSVFLLVPSFSTFVLVTLDFLSLIVQSEYHFLKPVFVPEIEYGIDDESLVLESS